MVKKISIATALGKVIENFEGRAGGLKRQNFKGKYKARLEFLEG